MTLAFLPTLELTPHVSKLKIRHRQLPLQPACIPAGRGVRFPSVTTGVRNL
jgi:hypothetical protein